MSNPINLTRPSWILATAIRAARSAQTQPVVTYRRGYTSDERGNQSRDGEETAGKMAPEEAKKREQLEDIFADLFSTKPIPSLRPPTSSSSSSSHHPHSTNNNNNRLPTSTSTGTNRPTPGGPRVSAPFEADDLWSSAGLEKEDMSAPRARVPRYGGAAGGWNQGQSQGQGQGGAGQRGGSYGLRKGNMGGGGGVSVAGAMGQRRGGERDEGRGSYLGEIDKRAQERVHKPSTSTSTSTSTFNPQPHPRSNYNPPHQRNTGPNSAPPSRTFAQPRRTRGPGAEDQGRERMSQSEAEAFNRILDKMYKDKAEKEAGVASVASAPVTGRTEADTVPAWLKEAQTPPTPSVTPVTPTSISTSRPLESDHIYPRETLTSPSPVLPAHEIEEQTYAEFDKKKEFLAGLKGDLEIWEWARKEVFNVDVEAEGNGKGFDKSYPLMLGYLIPLFRDKFHNPHLALAAFHLARTTSIDSYLSGCSTSVYNEVIKTHWYSFRNLRAIEEAVKEMSMNGVGWDRSTARTLSLIVESISKTQLLGWGTTFEGERRLEAEFGREVIGRLAALEQRVERDVRKNEMKVRMMVGKMAARRRRRDEMTRPAVWEEAAEWRDEPEWAR